MPSSPAEAADLVPRPGSVIWRYAGDARLFALAGYALLLQVAHPTVGAGVSEHSNFKEDPWGRLMRTLDYTYSVAYGGPELATEVGARVFEMHKRIKGVKPDGERYRALEPEAYAWVHATLADSIVRGNRLFAVPMSLRETERFWSEWRQLGRLVGVQLKQLPEGWAAFRTYFERMVSERLENTDAVQDVLVSLKQPSPPPVSWLGERAWRIASLPSSRLVALGTVGALPPRLRERFGVRWSRAQALELRAFAAASRAATPLMPAALRNTGPGYIRWRRDALERGEVAAAVPAAA
jgi:uncharacterized protein (DUF2236 family)